MKIANISTINFSAGKVHLFSDFDGTYLPIKESNIKQNQGIDEMKIYAEKMEEFFSKTYGDVDFHITTGRKFDSYKKAYFLFKEKNIHLPLPNSFITENGYQEFLRQNNNFFSTGIFPYNDFAPITRPHGSEKSKAYNPKKMLQDATENNDIIIVAGNHGNDKEMLNPLKYLDLREFKIKSEHKSFFAKTTEEQLNDIQDVLNGKNTEYINALRKDLENCGLIKKLKELPIYFIAAKKPKEDLHESILPIFDAFKATDKIGIFERGKLNEIILEIIKRHANKNKEFKDNMSEKLKLFVFGKTKLKSVWILIPSLIIASGAFIYYKTRNKKEI